MPSLNEILSSFPWATCLTHNSTNLNSLEVNVNLDNGNGKNLRAVIVTRACAGMSPHDGKMVWNTGKYLLVLITPNRLVAFCITDREFRLLPEAHISIRQRNDLKKFMLAIVGPDDTTQAAQHRAGGWGFSPYQAQQGQWGSPYFPAMNQQGQWGSSYPPAVNQQGQWRSPYPLAVNQQGWDTHHQPQQPVNTQQQRLLPPPLPPGDAVGQSQDANAHAVVQASSQEIVPAPTAYVKKEDNKLLYLVLAFMLMVLLMFGSLVVHCTNGMVNTKNEFISLRGETSHEFKEVRGEVRGALNEVFNNRRMDKEENALLEKRVTNLEEANAKLIEQKSYDRVNQHFQNSQYWKNKDNGKPTGFVGSSALAVIDGNNKKPENDGSPVYPIYDGQTRSGSSGNVFDQTLAGSSGNVFDKIVHWVGIVCIVTVLIAVYGHILPPPEHQRATTRAPRNRGDGDAIVARRRNRQD
jgi:hypothetical protein